MTRIDDARDLLRAMERDADITRASLAEAMTDLLDAAEELVNSGRVIDVEHLASELRRRAADRQPER
jgi:precorrin-6x reductase